MKNTVVEIVMRFVTVFLVGCSTWFFPHYVETRGTWTGTINCESLSRTEPTPFTASALVLTVESGPPINVHKMGLFSHTDTTPAQGSKFILVDSADQTILAPDLIRKRVEVKGTIYPWKSAMDSKTGEGISPNFWVLETNRKEINRLTNVDSVRKPSL